LSLILTRAQSSPLVVFRGKYQNEKKLFIKTEQPVIKQFFITTINRKAGTGMRPFKSLFLLMLFALSFNAYSADAFTFTPQTQTAHLDSTHIWFSENASNTKTGPELFAGETNADFFSLLKNMIINATGENKNLTMLYEAATSQTHGHYNRIIPDF